MKDTIFALSSGGLPCGVAIVRISGPQSRVVVETMCEKHEFGTPVFLSSIRNPINNEVLDKGIVLTFVGPNSFTGEDVVELHVHGGVAVIDALLCVLAGLQGFRTAEAGEFTYRAFNNGKLDLTQAEGIGDLIESESEAQRKLALSNVEGEAFNVVTGWSDQLLRMRALIEAEIDFVDEDDIPGSVSDQVWKQAEQLVLDMDIYLEAGKRSEVVRDGFRVILLGKPNSGKSTLLNCLAKRNAAIVSNEPGTTRDIVEIKLNLDGLIVYVSDTAGIRKTSSPIEIEGIRRAKDVAGNSDLKIWLHAADDLSIPDTSDIEVDLLMLTKSELTYSGNASFAISTSVFENIGIVELLDLIRLNAINSIGSTGTMLFTRKRQRELLFDSREYLQLGCLNDQQPVEIRAEALRSAAIALGKIVGFRGSEDVLGQIFSEFCVGK